MEPQILQIFWKPPLPLHCYKITILLNQLHFYKSIILLNQEINGQETTFEKIFCSYF